MMKALFNRWRTSRPFKDFYTEWMTTLKSTLLPLLSRSLSSPSPDLLILSTHVDLLHSHFRSYFTALDLAATSDATHLLFPDWRNPLEKPFLWLGDFHPYIFTNLLRSFLEDEDCDANDDGQAVEFLDKASNAWRNVDCSLWHNVEQMERGLRLMIPSIVARHRDAQAALVDKLAVGWSRERGELKVGEVVGDVVEELSRVFLDANRLRRSVLGDIIGALNVLQAALFLERLAQFYVGFWDVKLLAEFKKSHLPLG
uniref:DOG1 domain-containing protein n=1 Tax=Opuntia streptacantha TaxID=393608 RepID=A0A7C9EUC2_OPUST